VGKFYNLKTFSLGLGGGVMLYPVNSPLAFQLSWTKGAGRGPSFPPIFRSLIKGTRLLISVRMSPFMVFWDHWVNTIILGEKNRQINTHPSSFFWQKIQNSTFLKIGAWNIYSRILWHAESHGVIFIKITWLLGGVFPLSKIRKIFWGS